MTKRCCTLLLCVLSLPVFGLQQKPDQAQASEGARHRRDADFEDGAKPKPEEKTAYSYSLAAADGTNLPLSTYKGKVLLLVNLARNSSYNSQLAALQKINDTYKDKGLVVIGVPCNDFGAEEPGTDAEIQKSYTEAKVSFPIMARSPLSGIEELPLYLYLTKEKSIPENGSVHWNYTKFLIDRKGKPILRFDPDVAPDSPELLSSLEEVLSGHYSPHKNAPRGGADGSPDGDGPPN